VEPEALTTFLLERDQRFDLAAEELAAMDDAGVPETVIDALVAVSYPARFVVDRDGARPALHGGQAEAPPEPAYPDPHGWGWWGYGTCGYSAFCDYGYLPFAYGYGGRYGTFGYDPSWYGGYWGPAVIVVRDRRAGAGGMAVAGRGYTRGGQAAGGTGGQARPRGQGTSPGLSGAAPAVSGRSPSGGAGSARPTGYSRSGGSSSSAGSSGTARPRGKK
jgi:hypothetical protein